MYTFFAACAVLGVAVLVFQIGFALLGFDMDGDVDLAAGLDLLGVRSVAAGAAGFGLGGLAALEVGLPGFAAFAAAIVPGLAATVATAWLIRMMLRLERSGSLHMENAVGQSGTVRLSIPAGQLESGRVQFELQGRTLEMKAVTSGEPIPTGAPVIIVGLIGSDTVEVTPAPTLGEILE